MNAELKELSDILKEEADFNIPIYQRNYSWKKENCKLLLQDLKEISKKLENGSNNITHFMGPLVLVKLGKKQGYTNYQVVDGQQRLTTVTLILKALHDYLEKQDILESRKEQISKSYLINPFKETLSEKIKLKPINHDKHALQSLITEGAKDTKQSYLNNKIYINYKYFLDEITSYFKANNHKIDKIDNFYEAILKLNVAAIYLNESDNPQKIFESLNATGLDLDDSDLIRNFILMNLSPDEQHHFYHEYIVKIEKNVSIKSDYSTSDKVLIDLFARDFLIKQTGKNLPKTKILSAFKDWYQSKPKENLEILLENSKYYGNILNSQYSNYSNEVKFKIARIERLVTIPRIYLLSILQDYEKDKIYLQTEEHLIRILDVLYSYLVRKSISNIGNSGLNTLISVLHFKIEKNLSNNQNNFDYYYKTLVTILSQNDYIKNEEFKKHLIKKDFSNLRFPILKDLLYTIHNNYSDYNLKDYSIDYILPKKFQDSYGYTFTKISHKESRYKIGNLTFVKDKFNSIDFANKKRELTNYYSNFNNINMDILQSQEWTKETIEQRTINLADEITKYLYYPEPSDLLELEAGTSDDFMSENLDYYISSKDDITDKTIYKIIYDKGQSSIKGEFLKSKSGKKVFENFIINLSKDEDYQDYFQEQNIHALSCFSKTPKSYNPQPQKVNGYFIESNSSNETKINKLEEIAEVLDLDKSKLRIFTTTKYSADGEEIEETEN